jgi:hypothetical protein
MKPNEIKKLNERIQEYKDWKRNNDILRSAKTPKHVILDTKKRNQAKRQSRRQRGKG